MLDPSALALVAVAVFVGATLNSLMGFGFALTTVPLMAIAVGPKDAVVLSALFGLLSNGGVALRHRAEAVVPVLRRIVLGALVGMPIGLAVILVVPESALEAAIGVVVLAAVVLLARGWVIERPPPWVDVVAGLGTGLLNTSVGVSGPPVVMDLQGRSLPKGPFRATSAAVFGINGIVALALFAVSGQLHVDLAAAAAVALPAWPLGWWVGDSLHRRFPDDRFRGLVLLMLAATAVITLVGALTG